MSAESNAETLRPDVCPTLPGGDFGHSQTFSDIPVGNLTDIQLRAIHLTVQGTTDLRIAEMLSVSPKTLWRWKAFDEEYRFALTNARFEVHAAASDQFHELLGRAWTVLASKLNGTQENLSFRAAQSLLHMAGAFKPPEHLKEIPKQEWQRWPEPILDP